MCSRLVTKLTWGFLFDSSPRETEASLESVVPMALLDLLVLVVLLVLRVMMVLRYVNTNKQKCGILSI